MLFQKKFEIYPESTKITLLTMEGGRPSKNLHSINFCCSILVRLSLFVLLLYREDQVEVTIHQVAIIRQSLANTQYATYNTTIANSATTFLHNLNPLDLGNQRMLEV